MALPVNIDDLIHGQTVEWERIEFKEDWNPVPVIHSICAFANDINNWGGGYIIIGIGEKDGKPVLPPVGIEKNKIDKIQKELLNLCNRLKPHFYPILEPTVFQKKHILILWVPGGQNRPYQAPISLEKNPGYAYYIRRYSSTVKAQLEEERELISLAGKIPFDDRINHNSEISDLQLPLINSFLKKVQSELYKTSSNMDFEQLCKQMAVVDGTKEYLKPRNVGLLFFNQSPHAFIPVTQIEIVHFLTSTRGDRLDEAIFQGPIDYQIQSALMYIKNNICKEYIRKVPNQAEAIRFFNYPYVALEESIVNAMYHRDYEIREPVEIRIHPDRIEILSYPGPDRSIKQSDMAKGILIARRYRNRRIGEFLKDLKLTEGRCTGIPKIIQSMQSNGSPKPIFKTDDDRSYFITILPINKEALKEERKTALEKSKKAQAEAHEEAHDRAHDKPFDEINKLTQTEQKILELCKTKDSSKREILDWLGKKSFSGSLKKTMKKLLDSGLISQTLPDKLKSHYQKYAITEKGLDFYNKIMQKK